MLIVWSGRGFLVPVFTFGSCLLTEVVTEAVFKDDAFYQRHAWPLALALTIAAGATFVVGRRLNQPPAAEQPSLAPPPVSAPHTLFWLRMEYWAALLLAAAGIRLAWGAG